MIESSLKYLKSRGFLLDEDRSDSNIIFMHFIYNKSPFKVIEVAVGYGAVSITIYDNSDLFDGFKIAHNFEVSSVSDLDFIVSKSPINCFLN